MRSFCVLLVAAVLSLTQTADAQDARIKWCQDALARLGQAASKARQPPDAKPAETPVVFPLDLTMLNAADLEKAAQQIREAQGSDFLVADYATLSRPEIQDVLRQAPGRLVLKVKTGDAEAAKEILRTHTKKISLLLAIPTTAAEVKQVFGDKSDAMAALATLQLKSITSKIAALHSQKAEREVVVQQAVSERIIFERIDNAGEGEFIVIVGHNDGEFLKLPNGESIEVARLNEALGKKQLKGIVLTCESIRCIRESADGEVVTNRKLRFDEIVCALLAVIKSYTADASCGCADNILRDLSTALTECFGKKDAKFKVMVRVVGGAIVVATIVELVDIEIRGSENGDQPSTEPATPR